MLLAISHVMCPIPAQPLNIKLNKFDKIVFSVIMCFNIRSSNMQTTFKTGLFFSQLLHRCRALYFYRNNHSNKRLSLLIIRHISPS